MKYLEPEELKVGDKVLISPDLKFNIVVPMLRFAGKVVTIKEILPGSRGEAFYNTDPLIRYPDIRFEGSGQWTWSQAFQHFTLVKSKEDLMEEALNSIFKDG